MKPETIEAAFRCTRFSACLALLIIRGRVNPADHPRRFPKLEAWLRQCYHEPRRSEQKLAALLLDHGRGRWKLTSWGDWYEAHEAAHLQTEEN